MTRADEKLVEKLKFITSKGCNAEVKKEKNGNWVVYEVNKKKSIVS
ncbi:hypothetical protein [Butyrivibrio sp. FC2001]|nr:hypothetical protein [Butyrivibrio sp. FC2001]